MVDKAAPQLQGDAREAVGHRDSHLQIIASAGSGKTEVVAQRVTDLIATGVDPGGIIAFTFTERAAQELKTRISARVEERLGTDALDRLGAAFIGTIHGYCFRLLQQEVPRYETYDVLDEKQLTALLSREAHRLCLKELTGKLFSSIQLFLSNLGVVENELLSTTSLEDPFREIVERFYGTLEQYRLLTYGQQIARAVEELQVRAVAASVHAKLRHLIVDEYQDVNPAQERLIELLAGPQVELCVVGDDDQAIYQWRGSQVSNIIEFDERYQRVAMFRITANRRSRPSIVAASASFADSIPDRLDKEIRAVREPTHAEVVSWVADTEVQECDRIAESIQWLHAEGRPYRDIGVLVRTRAAYPELLRAFDEHRVPVQPGGRTGLFERPEARLFGKTYAWLVDHAWSPEPYEWGSVPNEQDVFSGYDTLYELQRHQRRAMRQRLSAWKEGVPGTDRPVDLVGDFYDLLGDLGAEQWDADDPLVAARLGTLARCSTILADYESVRRRSRPDLANPGEQVGGQDRGTWYYKNLAIHIANYAKGAYEDFDGEPDVSVDAVDLTTVHKAKGLEWPVVFVPSLTKNRFPPMKVGQARDWLVPRHLFDAARYEGCDADERRAFYVAMTRARDWLSLSRHERIKNRVTPSPYHHEVTGHEVDSGPPSLPPVEPHLDEQADEPLTLTFSELAAYRTCGFAYRLRDLIGFQPRLAPELGYGKAVHHVMRAVAQHTQRHGRPPTSKQLDRLFDDEFFLPAANKPAHRQLRDSARRLVDTYIAKYEDDLQRVWETERPFELHLPSAVISGRADVILDKEDDEVQSLAIVDYKTSADPDGEENLQLAIYTDAGRREGLDVRGAYLHDLRQADRRPVDVSPAAVRQSEHTVEESVQGLRNRRFPANPGQVCRRCDVRTLCRWRATP